MKLCYNKVNNLTSKAKRRACSKCECWYHEECTGLKRFTVKFNCGSVKKNCVVKFCCSLTKESLLDFIRNIGVLEEQYEEMKIQDLNKEYLTVIFENNRM